MTYSHEIVPSYSHEIPNFLSFTQASDWSVSFVECQAVPDHRLIFGSPRPTRWLCCTSFLTIKDVGIQWGISHYYSTKIH